MLAKPSVRRTVAEGQPSRIAGLGTLAHGFDALLCDVWGVVHDGIQGFPDALDCLDRWRASGRKVVLVSNSPRPNQSLEAQLRDFGVRKGIHFDGVLSAGELAREAAIAEGPKACYHLGPARDNAIRNGLKGPVVDRLEEADYILCTGFRHDDRETVADYLGLLRQAHARELPLLCANPDLTVHRGADEVPCAGALAAAYEALGGQVRQFGKPYPAIYQRALQMIETAPDRVIALGDGLDTDIRGARDAGIASVFVTSGIHREAIGGAERADDALNALFATAGVRPDWVIDRLVW